MDKATKMTIEALIDVIIELLQKVDDLNSRVEKLEKQMSKSWNESGKQKQQLYEIVADVEAITKKVNRLSETKVNVDSNDELRKTLRDAFMNGDVVIKKIF